MKAVVFRATALKDLRNILAHFRDRKDGSDRRFEAAIEEELNYLGQLPGGYQVRRSPYRFAILDHFKYILIYAVANDVIVVYRIRHMHQRPLKRFSR